MRSIRLWLPAVFTVLSILAAGYQAFQYISAGNWGKPQAEMITQWDTRLQPLRDALPDDLDRVGYLDKSIILGQHEVFDGEEFFMMQYSVAPVALEVGIQQTWIIGNFDRDTDFQIWLDERIERYEIQSFGFGLYLIHRLDE